MPPVPTPPPPEIIMKFTYVMGTSFMKLTLFLHNVSSNNTVFSLLHETLHAGCIRLFAEVLELFTYTVFKLIIVCNNGTLRARKMEVRGCSFRTVGRITEISPHPYSNCLPCAQTGVWFGIVMQEEYLIHLPVCQNPSDLLL
jgi:hypothetical protein